MEQYNGIKVGNKAVLVKAINGDYIFRKIGSTVDVISISNDVSVPSGVSVLVATGNLHTHLLLDSSMLISEDNWKQIYNAVVDDIKVNLKRL